MLLLVLSAAQAAELPQIAPAEDATLFASPTRKDRIGRILVPVMINGKGPYRFIVDTGASYSTISPQLAQTLGLEATDEYPFLVNGVTGSARAPSVPIDSLQAGDLELRSVRLPVIQASVLAGADGILGAAGLKDERITVEFARNRVTISRSKIGMAPRGFQRVHTAVLQNGLMTVEVSVGGVRAIAVIDTGAERSLGNQALRERLRNWQNRKKEPQFTDVFGTTSDIARGEHGLAPIIVLGPLKLLDVDLIYGDFNIFAVWKMRERPAMILGMDVLGTVRSLGIDFRNRELYFEGAYLGSG
jgi:clan AA aspartic protease (TIGR02281 family)